MKFHSISLSTGSTAALLFAFSAPLGAAPVAPREFGAVTLDISGAKAISRSIPERKTVKKIQRATAGGALRFRAGAGGTYRVWIRASGGERDDVGAVETSVSIQIPRLGGGLDVLSSARRNWSVPAQVPEVWPEPASPYQSPYEPIFKGPKAGRDKREYRRKKSQRNTQKRLDQKQARDNYRRQAIRAAFADSLQDARDDAEKQLQNGLQKSAAPAR